MRQCKTKRLLFLNETKVKVQLLVFATEQAIKFQCTNCASMAGVITRKRIQWHNPMLLQVNKLTPKVVFVTSLRGTKHFDSNKIVFTSVSLFAALKCSFHIDNVQAMNVHHILKSTEIYMITGLHFTVTMVF